MDWTAAEPMRTPTVGRVAQPRIEADHGQPDSAVAPTGALGRRTAGHPLIVSLAVVQVAWLLALGYLFVRLVS